MYKRRTPWLKKLRYLAEASLILPLFFIVHRLPIDAASAFGAFIGRTLGTKLRVTSIAKRNLQRAMPELSEHEHDAIILNMWENLGRTIMEFPHVLTMSRQDFYKRVSVEGTEYLDILRNAPSGGLMFSGHLGNWEILPRAAIEHGLDLTLIYRHANNPYVENLITRQRSKSNLHIFPKGRDGAKMIVRALRQRRTIAMLLDQKMNDGIAVPFFGIPAMTAPAIAKLALSYSCPIIPATIERLQGAYFKVTLLPPLTIEKTDDTQKDCYHTMEQINLLLEQWIRKHPEQWFWVHQRWGKL